MEDKDLKTLRSISRILFYNIFISLILSILLISLEGTNKSLYLNLNIDFSYVTSVFLSFIILYPAMFFMIYILISLIKKLKELF